MEAAFSKNVFTEICIAQHRYFRTHGDFRRRHRQRCNRSIYLCMLSMHPRVVIIQTLPGLAVPLAYSVLSLAHAPSRATVDRDVPQ